MAVFSAGSSIWTPAIAHALEPYSGSRIFWDTASRRTVFSGGGYARIIELQDGRLMAVCESGGIKIAFSQDKGSTWGSATKIVSNPAGIRECTFSWFYDCYIENILTFAENYLIY